MSNNSKDNDFAPINVEISDRLPMASQRQGSAKNTKTQVVTKSNNALVSFLMVLSVGAIAASGYLYWMNTKQTSALSANEARIESLENRLSATGEEMDNSTVALQIKVTELSNKSEQLWEQMDKLWASAWRRNQQELRTVEKKVSSFQSDVNALLKKTDTKIASSLDGIKQVQNRVDSVNNKVSGQSNDILAINVEQENLQNTINKQNAELRQMSEKLILLEKRNTSLLQKLQQVENKLNELVNRSV
ncbi:hypothetical protein ACOI22_03880 [Glaciecola sp. 2405UD65-10]|uniref:hypothetical protein n=1 Tax=Glaciecola sp. 2405UD65-10 TaxID=3397244 RepID=UPI003B5AF263